MVRRFEAGTIETKFRFQAGGRLFEMPTEWWNTESWGLRFGYGILDPQDPFRSSLPGSNAAYIFVNRGNLDRLVQALHKPTPPADLPVPAAQDVHLSPLPACHAGRRSEGGRHGATPANEGVSGG